MCVRTLRPQETTTIYQLTEIPEPVMTDCMQSIASLATTYAAGSKYFHIGNKYRYCLRWKELPVPVTPAVA